MNKSLLSSTLILMMAAPFTAQAYVCTRVLDNNGVEVGPSLSWTTRSLTFIVHQDGTEDIAGNIEFSDIEESFRVWQTLNMGTMSPSNCTPSISEITDIEFLPLLTDDGLESVKTTKTRVGFDYLHQDDNQNLLIFHDDAWPHAGQSNLIIALTTTTYNPLDGRIFDADIEFNTKNFPYSSTADSTPSTDLMNTTVHEIGHFLGLGHTDDIEATMYPRANNEETKKRDLNCDDVAGLVFKYPANEANGYCTPTADCGYCAPPDVLTKIPTVRVLASSDGSSGCAATGGGLPLFLFLWAGMYIRRRKD